MESSIIQMGNRGLSRDEFTTLIAEASAIVNNTPLWTVPNHPDDPHPLTPAMILTMKSFPNPPPTDEFSERDLENYGQKRFRRVQYLSQIFWQQWRQNYIQNLSRRHKWKTRQRCISVNDVVLLRDKQQPRNLWPIAKVISVKRGDDDLVRSVDLKLPPLPGRDKCRIFQRCISDIVLLVPSDEHDCN